MEEKENKDNIHYIGVMFESKYYSTPDKPKFYGKMYEYKTTQDLKEGEIVTLDNGNRVVVIKENIPENELQFRQIDLIKEI